MGKIKALRLLGLESSKWQSIGHSLSLLSICWEFRSYPSCSPRYSHPPVYLKEIEMKAKFGDCSKWYRKHKPISRKIRVLVIRPGLCMYSTYKVSKSRFIVSMKWSRTAVDYNCPIILCRNTYWSSIFDTIPSCLRDRLLLYFQKKMVAWYKEYIR